MTSQNPSPSAALPLFLFFRMNTIPGNINGGQRIFPEQLAAGAPWHRALLEAMGMWTLPEESLEGAAV